MAVLPEVVAVGRTPDGTFTSPVVIAQSAGRLPRGPVRRLLRRRARPGAIPGSSGWRARRAPTSRAGAAGPRPSRRSRSPRRARLCRRCSALSPPPCARCTRPGAPASRCGSCYRALDDGAGVRTVVTVRSQKAGGVHERRLRRRRCTPASSTPCSGGPAKKLRGTLPYCVYSVSPSGAPSAAELLDRHASLSSARSCAAYAGAVGRLVVAEVDVHRLRRSARILAANSVVRRLAAAEIPKRRGMVEVVDANCAGDARAALRFPPTTDARGRTRA